MKKLVITEKSDAARRISTILSDGKSKSRKLGAASVISFTANGDDYDVISLSGHIIEIDYPKEFNDWSATSPVELVYAPQISAIRVKSPLDAIKSLMNDADEIIIATDFDREGELIGMETINAAFGIDFDEKVHNELSKVKRAKFSALTKSEVESAFKNLVRPDERLAKAAKARQVIDLCWGAVLTRLISLSSGQVGKNFMSVGRVQSPTLKLIVDRNDEIESFVPQPFWNVVGNFGMLNFKGIHEKNPFTEKSEAEKVFAKCKEADKAKVVSYTVEMKDEYKLPPFDTTQMQVEANKIGITPANAMKIAEELYMSGYISYPRTENTEYPHSLNLRSVLEKLKESEFKKEAEEILAQDKIIPSRGKRSTTDHPPIYPTAGLKADKLKGDSWKLYELIVRRFLATLAPVAKAEITNCTLDVKGEQFKAEGYVLKEQGWKKYYGKYLNKPNVFMPSLKEGDDVDIRAMNIEEGQTKPPYRYNQGSLIQEMDRLGLGTKSTRHDIIAKLYSRNYVQGNQMIPTASGIALTKALEKHGGNITKAEMTAELEEEMKQISSGEKMYENVVETSQKVLYEAAKKIEGDKIAVGDEIRSALRAQKYIGKCVKCGKELIIKRGKKSGNFIGCEGYPTCKCAYPYPKGAKVEIMEEKCPECGLPKLKTIRKGVPPEIACIDPDCVSNTRKTDLGICPKCNEGHIRMRYSNAGKRFAGCNNWPKCEQTYPLRPKGVIEPTGKKCDVCGAPVIKFGKIEECINPECGSKQ